MADLIADVPLTHAREIEHRRLLALRVNASAIKSPPGVGFNGGTPQVLTGAGAVDIVSAVTHLAITGVNALTLADGFSGQTKFIVTASSSGTGTLTPTNLGNGTTITFTTAGDSAFLMFTNGSWHFFGGTASLA